MITANELRIGNKIYGVSDRIETITVINENGFIQSYSGKLKEAVHTSNLKDCSPIPLTEEILLRAEFRKSNDKLLFLPLHLLSMEIHAVLFRGEWLIELHNDRKGIVTEVYKLHQLQNLVFSLTKKELEIKL